MQAIGSKMLPLKNSSTSSFAQGDHSNKSSSGIKLFDAGNDAGTGIKSQVEKVLKTLILNAHEEIRKNEITYYTQQSFTVYGRRDLYDKLYKQIMLEPIIPDVLAVVLMRVIQLTVSSTINSYASEVGSIEPLPLDKLIGDLLKNTSHNLQSLRILWQSDYSCKAPHTRYLIPPSKLNGY